jgi:membrane protease YdiL (CAAX protease family)
VLDLAITLRDRRFRTWLWLATDAWLVAIAVFGVYAAPSACTQSGAIGIAGVVVTLTLWDRPFRAWLWDTTLGQWKHIDDETVRTPEEAGRFSWLVLAILVVVAVSLTIQEYIGDRSYFDRTFPVHGKIGKYYELESFGWWSGWRVIGYVVMPIALILCLPGQRLRDYHVSLRHFFKHLWIYVVLFLCILPAVLYASTTPAFRHTYPFYRLANRSAFDLWVWEALYAAQFISLEFFFRGFILQGLRKPLGANAVFVMIVPYCMIHYGKPLPETLGAIFAGIILGTLAIRTRSIWGGVLIHIGVALTMDMLALLAPK